MPIIKNNVPPSCKYVRAEKIMNANVTSLRCVESVKKIYDAIKKSHHGFPILNYKGQVIGLIPKKFVLILIE